MDRKPRVAIVLSKCSYSKQGYGIRFEESSPGQWLGDWAFPIGESVSKREGYDRTSIEGTILFRDTYPGCPHCQSTGIFKCRCGKVACWDGQSCKVTCPWCGASGELKGEIKNLKAGADLF
ncbi:MAG: hypothetical protein K6U74_01475 [Firmicutes bacterium]|nr:hypothetical protein [Bacillota bacterium]